MNKILPLIVLFLFTYLLSACSALPEISYKSKKRVGSQATSLEFSKEQECYFEKLHADYYQTLSPACEKQVFYPSQDGNQLIAVLEINEQGRFIQKPHIRHVLEKVWEIRQTHDTAVTLFVHGWNHGGQLNDSDLHNYRETLNNLYNEKSARFNKKNIGIYIAWRGKTMPSALNYTTFWNRKNISVNIGKGDLGAFILDLERFTKLEVDSGKKATLVLGGHSFGASALYNALGPILISRFQDSITQQQILAHQKNDFPVPIQGVGDLVLLINPAIEAKQFYPLRETIWRHASRHKEQDPKIFQHNLKPLFVVLGSNGDFAVNNLFPAGRWLNTLTQNYDKTNIVNGNGLACEHENCVTDPKVDKFCASGEDCFIPENILDRHAIGNFSWFYTHWLTSSLDPIVSFNPVKTLNNINHATEMQKTAEPQCTSKTGWLENVKVKNNNWEEEIGSLNSEINLKLSTRRMNDNWKSYGLSFKDEPEHTTNAQSTTWYRNPYWFVRVNSKVIPGHSEIWNLQVGCFILSIVDI